MVKKISFLYMIEFFNYLNAMKMSISDIRICSYRESKYYFLKFSDRTEIDSFYTSDILFNTMTDCLYYPVAFNVNTILGKHELQYNLTDISGTLNIIPSYHYDKTTYDEIKDTILKHKQFFVKSINNYMIYVIALDNIYRNIDNGSSFMNDINNYETIIKDNGYNLYRRNYTLREAMRSIR